MKPFNPPKLPGQPALRLDLGQLRAQFMGLNPRDPASWPTMPRLALLLLVSLLVVLVLWFALLQGYQEALAAEQKREAKLREEFQQKLVKSVNLEVLKKQREQVRQYVNQLEKQLPSKAEMDALLSDINQAGLGRSLQFDLFRPGQVAVKEYYAELPIAVRVNGRYHDIGAFVADIAKLPRIVTLSNLSIQPLPQREGVLAMDATAKTFRYLDADEVAAQRLAAAAKAKAAKK
jgi:type IV pilus assembly protein PilO